MKKGTTIQLRPADLAGRSGSQTEFEVGDLELLNAVAAVIVDSLEFFATDSYLVASAVWAEFPELGERWGFHPIETLAESLLFAEILPLSRLFTDLFVEYNTQYFSGCLPTYQVRVVFDSDRARDEPIEEDDRSSGFINTDTKHIFLRYTDSVSMLEDIVRAMAYLATEPEDDESFRDQQRSLQAQGACLPRPGIDWVCDIEATPTRQLLG